MEAELVEAARLRRLSRKDAEQTAEALGSRLDQLRRDAESAIDEADGLAGVDDDYPIDDFLREAESAQASLRSVIGEANALAESLYDAARQFEEEAEAMRQAADALDQRAEQIDAVSNETDGIASDANASIDELDRMIAAVKASGQ